MGDKISFVCQKYLYFTSFFKEYFKILILLFLIKKAVIILIIAFLRKMLFLSLAAFTIFYLSWSSNFDYDFPRCVPCIFPAWSCRASWIYELVSFSIKKKSGHYFFKHFQMLQLLSPFPDGTQITCILDQQSPTFLASGSGFMEDNFFMN